MTSQGFRIRQTLNGRPSPVRHQQTVTYHSRLYRAATVGERSSEAFYPSASQLVRQAT
jgi:hypothetical protein